MRAAPSATPGRLTPRHAGGEALPWAVTAAGLPGTGAPRNQRPAATAAVRGGGAKCRASSRRCVRRRTGTHGLGTPSPGCLRPGAVPHRGTGGGSPSGHGTRRSGPGMSAVPAHPLGFGGCLRGRGAPASLHRHLVPLVQSEGMQGGPAGACRRGLVPRPALFLHLGGAPRRPSPRPAASLHPGPGQYSTGGPVGEKPGRGAGAARVQVPFCGGGGTWHCRGAPIQTCSLHAWGPKCQAGRPGGGPSLCIQGPTSVGPQTGTGVQRDDRACPPPLAGAGGG